jgi:hypothetical protein
MGNCGTKPKTSEGDDAPAPAEPRTPAGPSEGDRKDEEVAAPGEASQAVVAPRSEVRKMISTFTLVFPGS